MPLRAHEDIIVCYKHLPVFHPQITHGHRRKTSTIEHKQNCRKTTNYGPHSLRSYDSTDRYPLSILTFKSDKQKSALHPTQKPVQLLEWLIRSYTDPCAVVLDNCMGSGSTGIACINTGRNFIGIELDEGYYDVAKARINAANQSESIDGKETAKDRVRTGETT